MLARIEKNVSQTIDNYDSEILVLVYKSAHTSLYLLATTFVLRRSDARLYTIEILAESHCCYDTT